MTGPRPLRATADVCGPANRASVGAPADWGRRPQAHGPGPHAAWMGPPGAQPRGHVRDRLPRLRRRGRAWTRPGRPRFGTRRARVSATAWQRPLSLHLSVPAPLRPDAKEAKTWQ